MRRLPNEQQRLLAVTILAGGLCGLAAVAFHSSVLRLEALCINPATSAPGHSWIWLTILTPAVGGMVAGLGLYFWVPAAAGSGIPQVKVAFANRFGEISVKETVGKFVLCVAQIGAGASLGVEGQPSTSVPASAAFWRGWRGSVQELPPHDLGRYGCRIAAAFNAPSQPLPSRSKN